MAATETPAGEMGMDCPEFGLKGTDGQIWSPGDLRGVRGLVLFVICNHCPYVIAVADRLRDTGALLIERGFGVAAISSNDAVAYPADSFENMGKFAVQYGFAFPYLYDETQEVAKALGAVCTPDIFGFDSMLELRYRGRLDSAGRNPATAETVPELLNAMDHIGSYSTGPENQVPSIGCSIKWR